VHSIVLTNLVLGQNAVPEFLDEAGSPHVLAREVLALIREGPARAAQLAALETLSGAMAVAQSPSDKAAAIVVDAAENGSGRRFRRISAAA
jgi:lipid-A-disaccharide synthase